MTKKYSAALFSQQSKSSIWTAEAMAKYFTEVDHLDIRKIEVSLTSKGGEILHEGQPVRDYDCVYIKGSFRYGDLLRAIATHYQGKCYNPIHPDAYTIGHDKLLSHIRMQESKIPMPTTYLTPTTATGRKILEKINFPIVMKLPSGTQGQGVMFADSYAAASSLLDALDTLRQPFLIQEYVDTDGVDTRALVVGDRVVACMKRKAGEREKRSNIHAGGKGIACVLDSHTKKVALDAARAIGAEICAVDLLEGHKGAVVIELNLSPGLQGITEVTAVNVAEHIAKYLFRKTDEQKMSKSKESSKEILQHIDGEKEEHQIIAPLDFRGKRILLPEIVTTLTQLSEDEDVSLLLSKGAVSIKKFS